MDSRKLILSLLIIFVIVPDFSCSTSPISSPPYYFGRGPTSASLPPDALGPSPSAVLPPSVLGPSPSAELPPSFLGPSPEATLPPTYFGPSPSTMFSPNFVGPSVDITSPALPPSPSQSPLPMPQSPPPIKAAYWPSFNNFPASSIDKSYFTHIYYAFVQPNPVTYTLDIIPFHQVRLAEFINGIHAHGPRVDTILSIGGAGNNVTVFSQMASTESTRLAFINSTIQIAREYGFDGVDLDWEFPQNDVDMTNLALLFKQWRNALDYEAIFSGNTRLLLTSAVYFASQLMFSNGTPSYPGQVMGENVDWINPMCFDYYGSWNTTTGEHTALYDPTTNISTSFGIESWIQSGVPPEKIVVGLALYGHTWTLRDPKVNGVGAPTVGVGPGNGILSYSQIIGYNSENNAVVKFDKQSVSIYSYAGNAWIGYDDRLSTKLKVQFARARGLGGYFFWALGFDKNWIISSEASYTWRS